MDFVRLQSSARQGSYPVLKPEQAAFPYGLARTGVHEVAEAAFGDHAALTGFVLAAMPRSHDLSILWVSMHSRSMDHGTIRQAVTQHLAGRVPAILQVRTGKLFDALWSVEEGIRSSAVSLVIAELTDADFTATRRLTLASARYGVPVILLMPYTREGATAAEARWRVSAQPSSQNIFDPRALGHRRWRAVLERSRRAPDHVGRVFDLEYDDEALSLSLVSRLATRSSPPGAPDYEIRQAG